MLRYEENYEAMKTVLLGNENKREQLMSQKRLKTQKYVCFQIFAKISISIVMQSQKEALFNVYAHNKPETSF